MMSDSTSGSTDQQLQILDQMLAIGQAVQREITKNPKQVYQLIVEIACQMTEADCSVLYPYHPAFGEFYDLKNVAAHGLRYPLQLERRANKRRRLAARIHREGEIIHENVEQEDPNLHERSPFMAREEIKSLMGLSLRAGNDIVGILYVDYRKPHRFSEEERKLIRLLGQQAALAVSNAWLFQLAGIRVETVTKLRTIGQTLATFEDPFNQLDNVLASIARSAYDVLGADILNLYQYIRISDELVLPPVLVGERRYPQLPKTKVDDDDAVQSLKTGKPQYIHNAQKNEALSNKQDRSLTDVQNLPFVVREEVASYAIVPLIAANDIVGVMFVNYRTPQLFGLEQQNLIEAFATQAAVAIYNARLFEVEQKQRRQSETLRKVAQLVNSTLDRDEVIGLVLDQLHEVIEYDSASIQLIEGVHRKLIGARGFLMTDAPPDLLRDVTQDPLINRIVQERQSLVLSDVKEELLWDHIPQTARTNSWIGVPLVVGDQIIGLMTVDHAKVGYYTQESGEIVAAFANQAALAIRNAESFALEQRRNKEFQILHQAANKLAEQSVLQEIYQTAVQSTLEALQCRHSTIFILNKKAGELVAIARAGKLPDVLEIKHFKPGEGLAGEVAETGQPILVNDAAADERFIKAGIVPRSMSRSIVLAPIKIENEVVGVLSADKEEVNGFTPHQLELLETLALDVGIAINLHQQQDRLRAIAEFQRDISTILPIRSQLEQIYAKMSGLMDTSSMFVALYDEDTDLIHFPLVYENGQFIDDESKFQGHFYAPRRLGERRGLTEWVIRHQQPLLVENFETWIVEDDEVELDFRQNIKCCAVVPALFRDKIIGVIGLQNFDRPDVFDKADRDLLLTVAGQAAIALENAALYEVLERRVQALSTLNQVGQTLTSGIRLKEDDILGLIYEQTRKLTQTQNIYVALYDETTDTVNFKLVMEKGRRIDIEQVERFAPRKLDPAKRGKTEEVIFTRQPILHRTRAAAAAWYKEPEHREYKGEISASHLAVPMVLGEQVKGVLAIYDWDQEYAYNKQDMQVLSAMASQAAIALDNASLYHDLAEANQALERRVEALSALNEVGQTLTSGLRLKEDEILRLIYQQVGHLAHTQNVNIVLYDEKTDTVNFKLVMERGQRVDIAREERFAPRKINKAKIGKTEQVILTGEPLLHRTRLETAGWYDAPDHRNYNVVGEISASHLAVPMVLERKVKGVIAVYDWDLEYAYDEQDMQVLSVIAGQAAIALDNANLYYEVNQALNRRVDALTALNKVSQTLTSGIRLREDEILALIYEQTRTLTVTQDMYIALYDDSTQMIEFKLSLEKGQPVEIAKPRKADMERRGKTEEVIFTKRSILHKTKRESEAWYELPEHAEFIGSVALSWMGVPMILGERVLGVIATYDWERENAYDELDLQILSAMASQAAIALDNANLYYKVIGDLERRIAALRILNEVGQALTSSLVLKEGDILESIYQQTQKLTDTQEMYIALYDEPTRIIRFGLAIAQGKRINIAPRQANMERRGKTEEVIFTQGPLLHKTQEESEGWYKLPGHEEFLGQVQASYIAVPMMLGEKVLGVIAVYDWEREYVYDELDLQVLSAMASQVAIALNNATLYAAAREEVIVAKQVATLGTATAALQHRISNTLNIIGPNISRLRKHKRIDTSDETIREILDIIERNTKYTSDYINRIQELLKETSIQLFDINASLHDAKTQVGQEYQDRVGFGPIEIIESLDDSLPLVEASLGQITEIFRNLIENSYKAMGAKGGILTIASRRVDDWLEVEIRDTGPGIAPEMRNRLFTKPVPSKDPDRGSGLGLWLSALLIQTYSGKIEIATTGPNGTTVLIRFPITRP